MEIEEENKEKKFYMSQRTFFLTYPHCDLEKIQVFNWFMIKYKPKILIVSKETHLDGSFHIHVWIQYDKKLTIRNCNYFDINEYHCNITKIKKTQYATIEYALEYLTKEDKEPLKFGCDIVNDKKTRNKICKKIIEGKKIYEIINEYPQELYNYDRLRKNINLYNIDKNKINKIIERKCFWIFGPSGIGKSYLIRNIFNNIYEKSNNIWWDGYNSEDIVLIDDFDTTCIKLSYYLKIWGDNYRFNGEIKGGIIQPNYTKLIITSNYSIDYLFSGINYGDVELVKAIKRRFEEIYFYDRNQINDISYRLKIKYYKIILNLKTYLFNN